MFNKGNFEKQFQEAPQQKSNKQRELPLQY